MLQPRPISQSGTASLQPELPSSASLSHGVKAEFGFREIQMAARPGYGMAGAGGGLRQTFDTSDQVSLRPRQEFGNLIPLK